MATALCRTAPVFGLGCPKGDPPSTTFGLGCPKGDPPSTTPVPLHPGLENTSHITLQALKEPRPVYPPNGPVSVNVFDGSTGRSVSMTLKNADTIGKLKKLFLQERPNLAGSLDLAYNGKPTLEDQTLGQLGIREKATFITFQKCHGG